MFTADKNVSLVSDLPAVADADGITYRLTIPKWTPLTALVADLDFQGASIAVDGAPYTAGMALDWSAAEHTKVFTVTPTTGAAVDYKVVMTLGETGLMGGVIQGKDLNLKGETTTLVGKASVFGTPEAAVRDGNTLYVSDSSYNLIWAIDVNSQETVEFVGKQGEPGYVDDTGSAARFNEPKGMVIDVATHVLYVADRGNLAIRKVDLATKAVTTLSGGPLAATFQRPTAICLYGTYLYLTDGTFIRAVSTVDGTSANVPGPTGFAMGTFGGITVASSSGSVWLWVNDNNRNAAYQLKISSMPGTGTWKRLVGNSYAAVAAFNNGPGTTAAFNFESTVAGMVFTFNSLYVADPGNNSIRRITNLKNNDPANPGLQQVDDQGVALTALGSPGDFYVKDGNGSANIRYSGPTNLSEYVDAGGTYTLYVVDQNSSTVHAVTNYRGTNTNPFSALVAGTSAKDVDGTGSAARINTPWGLATNGKDLWLSDYAGYTIRHLDPATGTVTNLSGSSGVGGITDGTGEAARYINPSGMTYLNQALYVSDSYANTIRKIDLRTGVSSTLAGAPNQTGFADGTGANARLNDPHGLTNDGHYLYLTDYKNWAIRRIDPATGDVKTLAGGTPVNGSQGTFTSTFGNGNNTNLTDDPNPIDGVSRVASFYYPIALTTDGEFLYISDVLNCTIRTLEIATGKVGTLAGSVANYDTARSAGQTAPYANGSASQAGFSLLREITTDGTWLYVCDSNSGTIRKVDKTTGATTTLAGPDPDGTTLFKAGNIEGAGNASRWGQPFSLITDGTALYVGDGFTETIRVIH